MMFSDGIFGVSGVHPLTPLEGLEHCLLVPVLKLCLCAYLGQFLTGQGESVITDFHKHPPCDFTVLRFYDFKELRFIDARSTSAVATPEDARKAIAVSTR